MGNGGRIGQKANEASHRGEFIYYLPNFYQLFSYTYELRKYKLRTALSFDISIYNFNLWHEKTDTIYFTIQPAACKL